MELRLITQASNIRSAEILDPDFTFRKIIDPEFAIRFFYPEFTF